MTKEKIPRNTIIKEIKTLYTKELFKSLIPALTLLFFCVATAYQLKTVPTNLGAIITILLIIFFIFIIFGMLIGFFYSFTYLFYILSVSANKFTITEDSVYNKKNKGIVRNGGIFTTIPYNFYFEKGGNYNVPLGKNYKYSQNFTFSDNKLFENTNCGDRFYTIMVNKKIIFAYPTYYFEL